MNIILHPPTGDTGRLELAKRVARIHAEAVLQRIEQRPYSKDEKSALVDSVLSRRSCDPASAQYQ